MNCSEFEAQLQQFLDGELVQDSPEMYRHRRECRDCRERHAAALDLARGLRIMAWPAPPARLAPQLVAAVAADGARTKRMERIGWAMAASVALAVAAGTLWPGKYVPIQPVAVQRFDSLGSLSLDASMAEAGSALSSLVQMTALETWKQGQLLLPEAVPTPPVAAVDAWQQTLEPPVDSLRQAGQTLTTGLEPIAASAQRAFLTFVDDLSPAGFQQ